MKKNIRGLIGVSVIILCAVVSGVTAFSIFFDQALLVRNGTIYHIDTSKKIVALTFDDGPSIWTPQVLEELERLDIKATFFMIGKYVERYPQIARLVVNQGHEIGNHSYDHHTLLYYKMDELEKDIRQTEAVIRDITGKTTTYFRPPKAWLLSQEKKKIKDLGYKVILWSINSKDWVRFFDDKYITFEIVNNIKPGDIILLHDGGGTFATEGSSRKETIKVISRLAKALRDKGYTFATLSELLSIKDADANK